MLFFGSFLCSLFKMLSDSKGKCLLFELFISTKGIYLTYILINMPILDGLLLLIDQSLQKHFFKTSI